MRLPRRKPLKTRRRAAIGLSRQARRIASRRARGRRLNRPPRSQTDRSLSNAVRSDGGVSSSSVSEIPSARGEGPSGQNVAQIDSSARLCRSVRPSAADRIALPAARIPSRLQQPVLARGCADATERPVFRDDHVVSALTQLVDRAPGEPPFDLHLTRMLIARIEGARKVIRVEARRVDRGLKIEAEVEVMKEEHE